MLPELPVVERRTAEPVLEVEVFPEPVERRTCEEELSFVLLVVELLLVVPLPLLI